jgi:hypothetical protein
LVSCSWHHLLLTHSSDDEGRGDRVEKIKNEQIQKQKDGKGHWHEELGSDSESIVRCQSWLDMDYRLLTHSSLPQVKADRGDISADADTIKQLQKETENLANEKQK